MLAALMSIVLTGLVAFLLIIVAGGKALLRYPRQVGLFLAFYLADNVIISVTNHIPTLQIFPNHLWGGFLLWGWSGKVYTIAAVLAVLWLSNRPLTRRDVGLTLQQRPGSLVPSLAVVLLIAAFTSAWGSSLPRGPFDAGLLLYMAVLPGLNEELIYRGVLPACLEQCFPGGWKVASASFGWSMLIPTLVFALLHGLWFDGELTLHADIALIRNALVSGLLFAWLRERTGSLVMPVLAHGAWDFFFFLPRMV